jgi:hypothetical protein
VKIIAYCALHYGRDYIYWAIRSVIDHIDEFHVLYSPVGSHGHRTQQPCPDTRAELYAEAERAAGDKLRWHDGTWAYEGEQRNSIHAYAPDADVILVVDADEIWHPLTVGGAISSAQLNPQYQQWRVSIIHYWRSFHRCVLHDPAFPIRVINPRATDTREHHVVPGMPINHMGYAQRSELVEYKQHTHGHKGEWRKDDWFNTVFMANAQRDCHPVGSEYWNPEPVNPLDYMPEWMSEHPYFNQEIIP